MKRTTKLLSILLALALLFTMVPAGVFADDIEAMEIVGGSATPNGSNPEVTSITPNASTTIEIPESSNATLTCTVAGSKLSDYQGSPTVSPSEKGVLATFGDVASNGKSGTLTITVASDATAGSYNIKLTDDSNGSIDITVTAPTPAHTHSFTYTADGTSIVATCGNDDCSLTDNKVVATLVDSNNGSREYNEEAYTISIDNENEFETATGEELELVYSKDSEKLDSAPINVGSYSASLTVGDATVSLNFEIKKADQPALTVAIDNYIIGTPSTPSVTGTIKGDAQPTFYYLTEAVTTYNTATGGTAWATTKPGEGTYHMYAVIPETDNYKGYVTPTTEFVVSKEPGVSSISEQNPNPVAVPESGKTNVVKYTVNLVGITQGGYILKFTWLDASGAHVQTAPKGITGPASVPVQQLTILRDPKDDWNSLKNGDTSKELQFEVNDTAEAGVYKFAFCVYKQSDSEWVSGELVVHSHGDIYYTVSSNVITAHCGELMPDETSCTATDALTLKAAAKKADGDSCEATIEGFDDGFKNFTGLTEKPIITYYLAGTETKTTKANSGAESEGAAPVKAGKYEARISISNVTAKTLVVIEEGPHVHPDIVGDDNPVYIPEDEDAVVVYTLSFEDLENKEYKLKFTWLDASGNPTTTPTGVTGPTEVIAPKDENRLFSNAILASSNFAILSEESSNELTFDIASGEAFKKLQFNVSKNSNPGTFKFACVVTDGEKYTSEPLVGSIKIQEYHEHAIYYTANGNKITARCGQKLRDGSTCSETHTIELLAEDKLYNAKPCNAYIKGFDGEFMTFTGLDTEPDIKYYLSGTSIKTSPENSGSEGIGTAPVEIGEYYARIQIGSAVAYKAFDIYTDEHDIITSRVKHGTLRVQDTAAKGETVIIKATPDEGYELLSLVVTDEKDKEITVKDLGKDKYSFKMPAKDVYVDVEFGLEACDGGKDCLLNDYVDLTPLAWYHEGVEYVLSNGIMDGVSNKVFAPQQTVSRAMLVTMLWRMADSPVVNYAMRFSDVKDGLWYSEAVRWAVSEGIVTGYQDGRFDPLAAITREQFATIIYKYAQYKDINVKKIMKDTNTLSFGDIFTVRSFATEGVNFCIAAGILTGTVAGNINPYSGATRAEAACMLTRFADL